MTAKWPPKWPKWRVGLAFAAFMIAAASASHFWALEETGTSLTSLALGALAFVALLWGPGSRGSKGV